MVKLLLGIEFRLSAGVRKEGSKIVEEMSVTATR